jgi:hypothetical protein
MLKYSNRYAAGLQWQERALIYRETASVFLKAKLRQQVFWFFARVSLHRGIFCKKMEKWGISE